MSNQLISLIAVLVVIVVLAIVVILHRRRRHKGNDVHSSQAMEGGLSKQLYIANLDYRVREGELKRFFSQYGQIASAKVVTDTKTRRSKGFGFVTYATLEEATQALQAHGQLFNGRGLVVRMAKPR